MPVSADPETVDRQLVQLLQFWIQIAARTDFCLNIAVGNEHCIRTVVRLLEARKHSDRAFDLLFEQLEKCEGFHDERLGITSL